MSPEADLRIMESLEFSFNALWQWSITYVSTSSWSLLNISLKRSTYVITVIFPSSDRTSFVTCELFRTSAFFITKYSKVRVINFDLFPPFDRNSSKSQGVQDLNKLLMMMIMRFDLPRLSPSCSLIDTGF